MTSDRRSRPLVSCSWPRCAAAGNWPRPWCPAHYPQAVRALRIEIDQERRRRVNSDHEAPTDGTGLLDLNPHRESW